MTLVNDQNQREGWQSILLQAADHVSLKPGTYSMIKRRYDVLKETLDGASNPLLHDAHVLPQGSIRGRTAIRPPTGATGSCATVDADAVIWLPNAGNTSAAVVLKAVQDRFEEKSRVEEPIQELRRGIRIVYADENPGFHIDITPSRNAAGNASRDGCGHLVVTDRTTGWKESTPIGYADWLNAVADLVVPVVAMDQALRKRVLLAEATQEEMPDYDEYVDANPLRATIKLLKRHRDLWGMRQSTDKYKPISAVITTLAGLSYADVARDAAIKPRTPLDAMLEIVGRMPEHIRGYEGNWQVLNPADSSENFAEKWNRGNGEGAQYRAAFRSWHGEVMQAFVLGLTDLGARDALPEQMRKQFGIPGTLVEGVTDSLPGNWVIPGMGAGKTRNQIAAAGLAGAGISSGASQASANSLGRLG
jgi:hypothetical protein